MAIVKKYKKNMPENEEQFYLLKEEYAHEERKRIVTLMVISLSTLLISIIGAGFSYFNSVTKVSGDSGSKTVINTVNTMSIIFEDGSDLIAKNIKPDWTGTKAFTISNKGDYDAYYQIVFYKLENEFVNKNNFVYQLSKNNEVVVSQKTVPDEDKVILDNVLIKKGETHEYELSFKFIDNKLNQEEEKGKQFSTLIQVKALEN